MIGCYLSFSWHAQNVPDPHLFTRHRRASCSRRVHSNGFLFETESKVVFTARTVTKKFCLLWHKYSSKTFRGKGVLLRAPNQSVILIRLKEIILNGSSFTVKCIRMSAGKGQQKINKKPHFRCLPATTTDKICPPLE